MSFAGSGARARSRSREQRSSTGSRRRSSPPAWSPRSCSSRFRGGPNLGVGQDLLALAGLLALGRFALAAAAWDTANGFALMGASRDLTLSVFVEAGLILAVTVAGADRGHDRAPRDHRRYRRHGSLVEPGARVGCGRVRARLIAETGRQPVDNPDTHLELTMIHEGPLLEYAGRDLALLQWAAAARHWLVLVLAAQLFLPTPPAPGRSLRRCRSSWSGSAPAWL